MGENVSELMPNCLSSNLRLFLGHSPKFCGVIWTPYDWLMLSLSVALELKHVMETNLIKE